MLHYIQAKDVLTLCDKFILLTVNQPMKVTHCILVTWGLILISSACKKHTGNDEGGGTTSQVNVYVLGKVAD